MEIEEARPEFIEHPFFSKTNNVSRSYNNNNNGTRGNGSYYATNGSGEEDCGTLYESFVGDDQYVYQTDLQKAQKPKSDTTTINLVVPANLTPSEEIYYNILAAIQNDIVKYVKINQTI